MPTCTHMQRNNLIIRARLLLIKTIEDCRSQDPGWKTVTRSPRSPKTLAKLKTEPIP